MHYIRISYKLKIEIRIFNSLKKRMGNFSFYYDPERRKLYIYLSEELPNDKLWFESLEENLIAIFDRNGHLLYLEISNADETLVSDPNVSRILEDYDPETDLVSIRFGETARDSMLFHSGIITSRNEEGRITLIEIQEASSVIESI